MIFDYFIHLYIRATKRRPYKIFLFELKITDAGTFNSFAFIM